MKPFKLNVFERNKATGNATAGASVYDAWLKAKVSPNTSCLEVKVKETGDLVASIPAQYFQYIREGFQKNTKGQIYYVIDFSFCLSKMREAPLCAI